MLLPLTSRLPGLKGLLDTLLPQVEEVRMEEELSTSENMKEHENPITH